MNAMGAHKPPGQVRSGPVVDLPAGRGAGVAKSRKRPADGGGRGRGGKEMKTETLRPGDLHTLNPASVASVIQSVLPVKFCKDCLFWLLFITDDRR